MSACRYSSPGRRLGWNNLPATVVCLSAKLPAYPTPAAHLEPTSCLSCCTPAVVLPLPAGSGCCRALWHPPPSGRHVQQHQTASADKQIKAHGTVLLRTCWLHCIGQGLPSCLHTCPHVGRTLHVLAQTEATHVDLYPHVLEKRAIHQLTSLH